MREGVDGLHNLFITPERHFVDQNCENDRERESENQLNQGNNKRILRRVPEITFREHPLEMRPAIRLTG